jgi:hypothetical protein
MGIQINGQTDIISATDGALNVSGASLGSASASSLNISGIVTASSFSGPLTGNVTGNVAGNLIGAINSTGVSTITTLNATSIVGVTTAGITTAYIGSVNDGPISGARNRIINGAMEIDQRNAGASVTRATTDSNQLYILDRWDNIKNSNNKAYTIQRSGTAPVGFTSSLLLTITSTNGTNSSTDYNIIRQHIEGYNVADLMWGTANAKPVTLSFWVRSSITGTYAVCLVIQGAGNYPATYTVNSANTWEYKTMTVPGPTSGTWPTDNTAGLSIYFDIGVGSTYNTTTNTWTYGQNVFGGSGVTKLTETNGATWYITGVQLEAGAVATPFERRSYGQELQLCERYYQIFNGPGFIQGQADRDTATRSYHGVLYRTPMRAQPTGSVTDVTGTSLNRYGPGGEYFFGQNAASVITSLSYYNSGLWITVTLAGATTLESKAISINNNGTIRLSAEL